MINFLKSSLGIFLAFCWLQAAEAQSTNFGFAPSGSTQSLAVSGTNNSITLNSNPGDTVLIQNSGANTAFVRCGPTAATVNDFPIQAGWGIALNCPPNNKVNGITASSTTTLLVSKGLGSFSLTGGGGGGGGGGGNVVITSPITNAGADGVSNTLDGVQTYARTQCYNGTTWDRCTQIGTGTPGTPNLTTVLSVQGETGMTPLLGKIVDTGGTNQATVKAASTAPVTTDTSLVVGINPNSLNANGQATMANSAPVVVASDQAGIQTRPGSSIQTFTTGVTRPGDTNAYAANDAYANSTSAPTTGGFTFTSACRTSGGAGIITDAVVSASGGTNYQGEVWVFDQAVTAINDNAAFTVSDSDVLNLVGIIPFQTSDTTAANSVSYVTIGNLGLGYTCIGTANLRYLVKIMAPVTPANAEVLTVRIKAQN